MNHAQLTFFFIQSPADPAEYICKCMWLEASGENPDPTVTPMEFERALTVLLIAQATGKLVL